MGQLFRPEANATARFLIGGVILGLPLLFYVGVQVSQTYYGQNVRVAPEQPIQFSHRHHVSQLGVDCRYCHSSVQTAASAGIPSTGTCMTCHSQVWTDSPMLRPLRQKFLDDKAIEWNRVYDLPDFVYFNHSIHVNKGVGCETCHGRVDQMALVHRAQSLEMQWCLDCHRSPEEYLRPRRHVMSFGYDPSGDQEAIGRELMRSYNIDPEPLDNCYTCHR